MPNTYLPPGRRYQGYNKPRFFRTNPRATRFSNKSLLIVVMLVAVSVWLLIWGLTLAQGAP